MNRLFVKAAPARRAFSPASSPSSFSTLGGLGAGSSSSLTRRAVLLNSNTNGRIAALLLGTFAVTTAAVTIVGKSPAGTSPAGSKESAPTTILEEMNARLIRLEDAIITYSGFLSQIVAAKKSHPGNLAAKHFDVSYFHSLLPELKNRLYRICKSGAENPDSSMVSIRMYTSKGDD